MSKDNGIGRMKQSQQDRMLNLKKWREKRLHEETLPSGLQVILRDVDLSSVMLEGNIPNTLIEMISSEEFQKLEAEEAGKRVMGSDAQGLNVLLRKLVEAAFVEPLIGDVADDKHVLYSELTLDDKLFIFTFLNRDAAAVRSFRDK